MSRYTRQHWEAAKGLLRYLKKTKSKGLVFKKKSSVEVIGYTDASWASNEFERRSRTGYVFMVNETPVSWCSKLQVTVSTSAAEAEYMAICAGAQEAVYVLALLKDLELIEQEKVQMLTDNTSAIQICVNPVVSKRTKHIDIRYYFVRDLVNSGLIEVSHCPTEVNIADVLTKNLDLKKQELFTGMLTCSVPLKGGVGKQRPTGH